MLAVAEREQLPVFTVQISIDGCTYEPHFTLGFEAFAQINTTLAFYSINIESPSFGPSWFSVPLPAPRGLFHFFLCCNFFIHSFNNLTSRGILGLRPDDVIRREHARASSRCAM
jgi:hypothetical protein